MAVLRLREEIVRAFRVALSLLFGLVAGCLGSAGAAETEEANEKITFTKHVAAILWKNCAGCHRPGEVGPFSLLTYQDASKRAEFIVELTASRRMPPWKPEPGFAKYHDERRLSNEELATLAKWVADGVREGDLKDLPDMPQFPVGWQLGQPDLILKMPQPFAVAAGGPDVTRCFVIPIPIDEDRMVSAVEFRPGNHKVVHHAMLYLDSEGQGRKLEGADGKPGYACFGGPMIKPTGGLGAWLPGSMPRFLPDGIVKYLKQGSDLLLQIHYHPIGKAETDQSTVGIYFSKKPAKKIVTGIAVGQLAMVLPAGKKRCEVSARSSKLPVDVQVLGVSPHMHNLGREVKVTAIGPDGGAEIPLIWIKDWDFNWQGSYQFAQPITLVKGSVIHVRAIYDNSADNPKNPNSPPKQVRWGEQSSDEMLLCGVQVFTEKMSDLQQIAKLRGFDFAAGLEGGIPGIRPSTQTALGIKKTRLGKIRKLTGNDEAIRAFSAEPASEVTKSELTADVPEEAVSPAAVACPLGEEESLLIPEKYKQLLLEYDLDKDGRLSGKEIKQMSPPLQGYVLKQLKPTAAGK